VRVFNGHRTRLDPLLRPPERTIYGLARSRCRRSPFSLFVGVPAIAAALVIGALSYLPVLALGPGIEHLMLRGH
jgi:K+-transporting ATPase A subunit